MEQGPIKCSQAPSQSSIRSISQDVTLSNFVRDDQIWFFGVRKMSSVIIQGRSHISFVRFVTWVRGVLVGINGKDIEKFTTERGKRNATKCVT